MAAALLLALNVVARRRKAHHARWLGEVGEGELSVHADTLVRLGIGSRDDMQYVNLEDLVAAGLTAADGRRILGGAQQPPTDASLMMAPQPTLYAAAEAGLSRGTRPVGVVLASSAIGGGLLAFGGCMFVMLAGGMPDVAVAAPGMYKLLPSLLFPIGSSMVVFTGTDLLTSSFLYHSLPFLTHPHRNVNAKTSCKVWGLTFVGNVAGSVAIAAVAATYLFPGEPWSSWASSMAQAKTSMPFDEVFVKAVGANWLVSVAAYMSLTARSAGGKLAGLWLPVTTFVALDLEHSVANMFLIPYGMMAGATELHGVGLYDLLVGNLAPCVLGNLVGAAVFVSFLPWYTDWYPNVRNKARNYNGDLLHPNHQAVGPAALAPPSARKEREASQMSKLWHGKFPRYSETGTRPTKDA